MEDILPLPIWIKCLENLSLQDRIALRGVSLSFLHEIDHLCRRQKKLWIRNLDNEGKDCFDDQHRIPPHDALAIKHHTITLRKLHYISKLFPSVSILKFDPMEFDHYQDPSDDYSFPIAFFFPHVTCLVAQGHLYTAHFAVDSDIPHPYTGSKIRHILAHDLCLEGIRPTSFPFLESIELVYNSGGDDRPNIPKPSRRIMIQQASDIKWSWLPRTIEKCVAAVSFSSYERKNKHLFPNLTTLGHCMWSGEESPGFCAFLQDHRRIIREISMEICVDDENVEKREDARRLLPLLSHIPAVNLTILKNDVNLIREAGCVFDHLSLYMSPDSKNDNEVIATLFDNPIKMDKFTLEITNPRAKVSSMLRRRVCKIIHERMDSRRSQRFHPLFKLILRDIPQPLTKHWRESMSNQHLFKIEVQPSDNEENDVITLTKLGHDEEYVPHINEDEEERKLMARLLREQLPVNGQE